MTNKLTFLLQKLIERNNGLHAHLDQYNAGCLFYFNLNTLHELAGKHKIDDIRSPEGNGIVNEGGYNTVQDLNFPELEEYLWKLIKPTVESNGIVFTNTCVALTYNPKYKAVRMHLHRESLREINPCPYNYTFFYCTDKNSKIYFNFIDVPTPKEDIFSYGLINYSGNKTMYEYIQDKPKVEYILQNGDAVRFDATKAIHGAGNLFTCDQIGIFLVLLGVSDNLPYKLHRFIPHKKNIAGLV